LEISALGDENVTVHGVKKAKGLRNNITMLYKIWRALRQAFNTFPLTPSLSRREREQQHSSGFVLNTLSRRERETGAARRTRRTSPLSRREREQQHSSGFVLNTFSRWERGGVRGIKQDTLVQGQYCVSGIPTERFAYRKSPSHHLDSIAFFKGCWHSPLFS